MTALPEGITQADVDRLATLEQGLRVLSTEYDALKAKFKEAITHGEPLKATKIFPSERYGNVVLKFGVQARVDEALLSAELTQEKAPEFWSLQLDKTLIPSDLLDGYRTKVVQQLSVSVAQ